MHGEAPPSTFQDAAGVLGLPREALARLCEGHRPWRKVRYVAADLGMDPRTAWSALKAARWPVWHELPLPRSEGGRFGICLTPALAAPLHTIDRASGDDLLRADAPALTASPLRKRLAALFSRGELIPNRLRVVTVMGEAAESSILEGASATRAQALDMLRSGRPPATPGERMILNNYEAMQFVKRSLGAPLSLELLLEIQSIVTEGTLHDPAACGRFRRDDEPVRVVDTRDSSTVFTPPPAQSVVPLLKNLCHFANGEPTDTPFLHPIVRACIMHFMVGYIHPFVDGNGRTARAVFYWYALRHGYSVFEFVAISEIIREGQARYPQAYLDSEHDEGDLTYFVLYHLAVIEQALERLAAHLGREELRIRRSERFLAVAKSLNLRQRLILDHAVRHPSSEYSVKSHARANGVTKATARTDLESLRRRQLLTAFKKTGKEVHYRLASGVKERLARLTA